MQRLAIIRMLDILIVACVGLGLVAAQADAMSPSAARAAAALVYTQPPSPAGGLLLSSLRDPDGSDSDQWVWDGFALGATQVITEVRWQGGYDPLSLGSGGVVNGFRISFYASIPSGFQPDISQPPLVHYDLADNAGETPAAVLGGVQTYDYHYVLPAPFQAEAQAKYWIQIEALQSGSPDWGLSKASSGDGQYFRRIAGEGANYQLVAGDAAFSLWGANGIGYRVYLPMILKVRVG